MQWPDYFPDDCPPAEAQPASGQVHRLIAGQGPTNQDFRPYREIYPMRKFDAPECMVCGLSVYRDIADIARLKARVPAMRKRLIADGVLQPSLGKILHTPGREKSHHTWWTPVGAEPWLIFEVMQRS
jgi:hypothetical protein